MATVTTRTHCERPDGRGNADRWQPDDWIVTELQADD